MATVSLESSSRLGKYSSKQEQANEALDVVRLESTVLTRYQISGMKYLFLFEILQGILIIRVVALDLTMIIRITNVYYLAEYYN